MLEDWGDEDTALLLQSFNVKDHDRGVSRLDQYQHKNKSIKCLQRDLKL